MTIAAALMCRDGIVLGADTEYTFPYALKVQGPKLFDYIVDGLSVVFAGAGDVDFIKMTVEKIIEAFKGKALPLHEVKRVIENTVHQVYKRHIYPYPGPMHEKPQFDLLAATSAKGEPLKLFKTSRTGILEVNSYACIGDGMYLGRFIADQLYHSEMSVLQGLVLSSEMLAQAIRYVPGCGGGSQVWILYDNGYVVEQTEDQIRAGEDFRLKLTDLISTIFFELFDRSEVVKHPNFQAGFNAFLAAIILQFEHLETSTPRYDPAAFKQRIRDAVKKMEEIILHSS